MQVSLALFPAYIHQSGRSWPQAAQGPKSLLSSVEHPQSAVEALTLKAEGSEVYVGSGAQAPGNLHMGLAPVSGGTELLALFLF